MADHHEAIGIRIGQRPQEHGVHDAEDRAVRTDAERKRNDGDRCEPGRAREHSRGIPHVARNIGEDPGAIGRRNGRHRPRSIRACDLERGAFRERRKRGGDCFLVGQARCDEILVMVRDVLRELVDDIGFTRRIDGEAADPRAHERFPVRHDESARPD